MLTQLEELPNYNCSYCPRLAEYRNKLRLQNPSWHNGPVSSFGDINSELLIVGLAPGKNGANRTGRPFTGDGAGDFLYPSLVSHGFAAGTYSTNAEDNLKLINCRITNAVRCLPPQNKPVGEEIKNCRNFLISEIYSMPKLKIILALGRIAHCSIVKGLEQKQATFSFTHNTFHQVSDITLVNSYHCSRYNINTKRLTKNMFDIVLKNIRERLEY